MFSVEPIRGQIGGIDSYAGLVDINAVYAGDPNTLTQRAYSAGQPFMFQEGIYENEHDSSLTTHASQALITYLGGGLIGHVFGSCPLWSFGMPIGFCDSNSAPFDTWQNSLNSPGSIAQGAIGTLMRSRKWWTMVPDYANTVVTSAKGNSTSYHATAREATGQTVMVWAPNTNPITVNMAAISGTQVRAWWFNSDDGSSVLIGTFPPTGSRNFTPARARKVLVLDDDNLNLAAPGTTVY